MTNLHEVVIGYRTSFQKQRLMAMKAVKHVKDCIYWFYFQYLLIFCCVDLEPWEQMVIHTVVATTITMLVFTAYVFVPIHLRLAFRFFLQVGAGRSAFLQHKWRSREELLMPVEASCTGEMHHH